MGCRAINDFQLDSFDKGDYQKAVEQENLARNIVDVLYPNDNHYAGKELRLKQQYFFISASVQAAIAKYKKNHHDIRKFYEKATFQLNDTHPTVAVAELMRILLDEEGLEWDEHGKLPQRPVLTPTTPSWQKHWKNGRSSCSPDCFLVSTRSSRRSTAVCLRDPEKYPGNQEKVRKMAIIYDGQVKWHIWQSVQVTL